MSLGRGRRSCLLELEHDLMERVAAEVAFRLEIFDEFLEGQVLMSVGAYRGLVWSAPAVRERWGHRADHTASTIVLTKNPISPSSSLRVRPATGDPTATRPVRCSDPVTAKRPPGTAMNSVAPCSCAKSPQPLGHPSRDVHRHAAAPKTGH